MSGSGRESLQDDREWSGGRTVRPVVVMRPYRMSGVVGRTSRKSGRPSQISESGLETPAVVWE